jgi:hypothetical protein
VRFRVASLLGAAAFLTLVFGFPSTAWAVSGHVFDPTLSLTGSTVVSAQDEVPDPGLDHPGKPFEKPCGVAVDRRGDIYVATPAIGNGLGTEGRVDVFGPQGEYLTEISDENQPCSLAVDSEGNVYVMEYLTKDVVLFEPDSYPPSAGSGYGARTIVVEPGSGACSEPQSIAVDPSNDHLYFSLPCRIVELNSAVNGSTPIVGKEDIGLGLARSLTGVDVYGKNHDVYATGAVEGGDPGIPASARAFVFDGVDGHLKEELDGTNTPAGGFGFIFGGAGIAVDQANGDVYVDDTDTHHVVDQFDASGSYIGGLEHFLKKPQPFADIAVDDPSVQGEAGYESPNEGYVYVTSDFNTFHSHLYAFEPKFTAAPEVRGQTAIEITETEAVLEAEVNPRALATSYHFEYTSAAEFEAHGYASAARAPAADVEAGAGGAFVTASEPIAGLGAGTTYRFRLVAGNESGLTQGAGVSGGEGQDAGFTTYPAQAVPTNCVNQQLRGGSAADLPDCRAYELVTPPDTNGRIPSVAAELGTSADDFSTPLAAPGGNGLLFGTEGGSLPGIGGGGFHDTYEALRTFTGWQSHFVGLSGAQAQEPYPGGISADHRYSFWETRGSNGTLSPGSPLGGFHYLRGPDGVFEPIGMGSLGQEPHAIGKWIDSGGGHVVFATEANNLPPGLPRQLEPDAPASGTGAVYDRSPGGGTRVISLLPGNLTPAAGVQSFYEGASANGSVVLFRTNASPGASGPDRTAPLYARIDNARTVEVTAGESFFAGASADGSRLFYLLPDTPPTGEEPPAGSLFVYDTSTGVSTAIGSGNEATVVNVSLDGSHVYFVSPQQLDGANGAPGAENLYVWNGLTVSFIATVDPVDVSGEDLPAQGQTKVGGLALWITYALSPKPSQFKGPASDPSRTTPDGRTFIFQSRASLTGYESGGHSEIFRFDEGAGGPALTCLSCNPTGAPAVSSAQLQSNPGPQVPVSAVTQIGNVTADGQEVFFQSADRLVARDTDQKTDVYEWKAGGTGVCQQAHGCLYLISSGDSGGEDYLYGMTADGRDVFFESGDRLLAEDSSSVPSVYDARVEGGFAVDASPAPCAGDACQGPVPAPPALSRPAAPQGSGNVKPRCHRPKGRHRAKASSCGRPGKKHGKGKKRRGADR